MPMLRARAVCTALLLLCLATVAAGRARATSFVLNLTTDPSLGTIVDDVDASSNVGKIWTSAEIAIAPIMVNQGDDITVNVTFSGGFALQFQSGVYDSGREGVFFGLLPLTPGTSVQASSTLTSLSGVAGDLDAVLPIMANFAAIDQITGGLAVDMTDTSFQFDGFSIQTIYTSLTGGPVTLSSVELLAGAENVAIVPEPSTGLLLAAGLITLARLRARR